MNKMILSAAMLGLLSTASFALDKGCHLTTGNWANAATQSCPSGRTDGKSDPIPPKPSCEEGKV